MIKKLKSYFVLQIQEIADDPALRFYGIFLALGQFLTYLYWRSTHQYNNLASGSETVCWPFFENCFDYRIFDASQVNFVFKILAVTSFAGMLLFISRKHVKLAYVWLLAVNILKMFILFQDFRLRLNQHYMLFFVTFVFLFLPNKRNLLRYTLVLFYIWPGTLKINHEWLSGKALYADPLWIHGKWIPPACAYAVILELFISLGVLFKNRWIYWTTLFQFFLFHVVSWPIVKFFYPLLMMGLLMIFPLTRFIKHPNEPESLIVSLCKLKQPLSTYGFILFFCFLQFIPKFMPGDSDVTGEGRLFALHMFDAQAVCKGQITLRFKNKHDEVLTIPRKGHHYRIKCDPAVAFGRAKWNCYYRRNDPDFVNLDVYYEARRNSEAFMRPLVDVKNFCSEDIHYQILRPNDWIKKY